jgi:hypothetical protein
VFSNVNKLYTEKSKRFKIYFSSIRCWYDGLHFCAYQINCGGKAGPVIAGRHGWCYDTSVALGKVVLIEKEIEGNIGWRRTVNGETSLI